MGDFSAIKAETKKHIAKGDLELAFVLFGEHISNKHEVYDHLIMLTGRFNAVQKSRATGTLSESEFLLERAKLSEGLKTLINEFDGLGFEEPAVKPKPSSGKVENSKKMKSKTDWLKLIAFLQALILLGIAYIIFQLPA